MVIWTDEDDNVLGEISREKAHAEGLLHRVAVVYLENDQGQILVNERAKDGHLDHSSAGHVDVGETYLFAARRELLEELGIDVVDLREIGKATALSGGKDQNGSALHIYHIFDIFLAQYQGAIKQNPTEVARVYWENPESVREDMNINPEKYSQGFVSSIKVYLAAKAR